MAFNRAFIKGKERKSPESRGNHKIKCRLYVVNVDRS